MSAGVPRRGLPADQAEDRAGLGRRAGTRRPRTVRRRSCSRWMRTPPIPWPKRANWPPWTRSTCCLSSSPWPRTTCAVTPSLPAMLRTPVCLDESITSARAAADAIALGACRIVNIKPGRVGGYLEARRVHDICAAHDVPVWCGGMLETGIGRAANVALAALPGFVFPGDTSGSARLLTIRTSPSRSSSPTATCRSPPAPASASSPFSTCWDRSPPASGGCRTAAAEAEAPARRAPHLLHKLVIEDNDFELRNSTVVGRTIPFRQWVSAALQPALSGERSLRALQHSCWSFQERSGLFTRQRLARAVTALPPPEAGKPTASTAARTEARFREDPCCRRYRRARWPEGHRP